MILPVAAIPSISEVLAIKKFSRELGRVSNFNKLINWHHHMKNHVEIGHLTKDDAFRVNRDRAMNLEIWFKIHTNVSNIETASPKIIWTLKFFMISVIFYKMGNHSNFHLSFFQIVGAWQNFTVVTKLIKNLKSLYVFWRVSQKLRPKI